MTKVRCVSVIALVVLLVSMGCQPTPPRAEKGDPVPSNVFPPPEPGQTYVKFSGLASNLPRIALYMVEGLARQYQPGKFRGDVLFVGPGGASGVRQVGEGITDFSASTPAAAPFMASRGIGIFSKAYPDLRGVLKLPRRVPVTLAVRADLGVKTFDEIIQKKIPIKIASRSPEDTDWALGFLFAEFLKAYGTSLKDLESWGGKLVPAGTGTAGIAMIARGEANAIFHEGGAGQASVLSDPAWKKLNQKAPMVVLSIREDVIEKLGQFGFRKFEYFIPKGKYPGVAQNVTTIDLSDWIVVTRASVPEDIVYKITKVGVENKGGWEGQYRDLLPMGSKEMGQYVADPKEMWKDLGVPLHPGAERYFKENALMP